MRYPCTDCPCCRCPTHRVEQWSQNSGSNVIPRRARPGLAGLAFYCNPKGRRALLRVPSTFGRSVCLCWALSKPQGPKASLTSIQSFLPRSHPGECSTRIRFGIETYYTYAVLLLLLVVRTGSWTGPPRGKSALRVGISSTVCGVRAPIVW